MLDAGVRRLHVLAWRDLDDPDAGGSEVHADEFMRRWAAAGLDIVHRTSAAVGLPATDRRNGYGVIRRGSRYSVFPRTAVSELTRSHGSLRRAGRDLERRAVVLARVVPPAPHLTVLHHVHGPMWDQIMPRPLAGAGRAAGGPGGAAVLPRHRGRHAVRRRRATSCWSWGSGRSG